MSLASRGTNLPQVDRTLSLRRSSSGVGDIVALMKPRVMCAVRHVGRTNNRPGQLDPGRSFVALLCIAVGAGGAACSTCGTTPTLTR
jgi:hypothetical protein